VCVGGGGGVPHKKPPQGLQFEGGFFVTNTKNLLIKGFSLVVTDGARVVERKRVVTGGRGNV